MAAKTRSQKPAPVNQTVATLQPPVVQPQPASPVAMIQGMMPPGFNPGMMPPGFNPQPPVANPPVVPQPPVASPQPPVNGLGQPSILPPQLGNQAPVIPQGFDPSQPGFVPPQNQAPLPAMAVSVKSYQELLTEACNVLSGWGSQLKITVAAATKELCSRLLTEKNVDNRFQQPGLLRKYTAAMTTPLTDDEGNAIVGTTEWQWTLPVFILIDTAGKMHNGQHCLQSLLNAFELIENASTTKATGGKPTIDYEELGITTDTLRMTLVIVDGIDPNSANYIDTGRSRTLGDIVYRNRREIFQHQDYSTLLTDGKTEDDIASKKNSEAHDFATALRIIAWRRWYNGQFIRGDKENRAMSAGQLESAYQEFPGMDVSVHSVFLMNQTQAFKDGRKHINVSLPYLMASHYLAMMSVATPEPLKNKAGQPVVDKVTGKPKLVYRWNQAGKQLADNFISLIVYGDTTGNANGPWREIERLRTMFNRDAKIESEAPITEKREHFLTGNEGNKFRFLALGWAFRHYVSVLQGKPDRDPIPFGKLNSGTIYPVYGDGNGFDKIVNLIPEANQQITLPAPVAGQPQPATVASPQPQPQPATVASPQPQPQPATVASPPVAMPQPQPVQGQDGRWYVQTPQGWQLYQG